MASQVGSSRTFCSTSSSSSRLVSCPCPFSVLRLILSGDRFLVNLQEKKEETIKPSPSKAAEARGAFRGQFKNLVAVFTKLFLTLLNPGHVSHSRKKQSLQFDI